MNLAEKYFRRLFHNQGEMTKEAFIARVHLIVSLCQRIL